jgi:hypothetical protein
MAINTTKPRYNSIQSYLKLLRKFPRTGQLQVGRFYCFSYKFLEEYDWEILRHFDFLPLTYIFSRTVKHAIGINFHQIPPLPRQIWLSRVKQISQHVGEPIEIRGLLGGRPVYKIRGLNYPRVWQILRKTKVAIRKYRVNEIHQLRSIDLRVIDEVMKYFANTYVSSNIQNIRKRYNQYRP